MVYNAYNVYRKCKIEKFNLVGGHWKGFFEEAGVSGRRGPLIMVTF